MLGDKHPDLDLMHRLRSPITNIELVIGLLRRTLAPADHAEVADLLAALQDDTARLIELIRLIERHTSVEADGVRIELPRSVLATPPPSPQLDRYLLTPQRMLSPDAEARTTILIIEDSATFRSILAALLRHAGFHVLEAEEPISGLDLARAARPDLIILDLILPLLDGQQLAAVLHDDPETRRIPLLICTAIDGPQLTRLDPHWRVIHKSQDLHEIPALVSELIAERRQPAQSTVLVIDDDNTLRPLLARSLSEQGFNVLEAASAAHGLELATRRQLDLIVLDLLLPDLDGFDVLTRLRRASKTILTPIILLSGVDALHDKINAFQLGADDYVTKPFQLDELLARIRAVLRRHQLEGDASPSTMLPGNVAIDRVLTARIAAGEPFAIGYADLDNFKAYNDGYGFLKGDSLIRQTARIITGAVERMGGADDFVGHVGGDDFVFVTTPDRAEAICRAIIDEFDALAPLYYDTEARTRGYIDQLDRQGHMRRFPIVSISIGVVNNAHRPISHPAEVSDIAAELKKYIKQFNGSIYLFDRRRTPDEPHAA